jgi:hypothetical protein
VGCDPIFPQTSQQTNLRTFGRFTKQSLLKFVITSSA